MKIKKVLYIDYLDKFSLLYALIFGIFFNKVVFHNADIWFQSKKNQSILNKFGISWVSYHNVPIKIWCSTFKKLNHKLAKSVLKNIIKKNTLYTILIKYFNFDYLGERKLQAAIINFIGSEWFYEGTSSFSLIDNVYPRSKYKLYYMPQNAKNYLLAIEHKEKIKPISYHFISKFIFKINSQFFKIFKNIVININHGLTFKGKQGKKYTKQNSKKQYEIAFVPHSGFKYGNFFKKTYLYDNDPDSIFYKNKVLTLSFNDFDSVSERFCSLYKIPHLNVNESLINLNIFKLGLQQILSGIFSLFKKRKSFLTELASFLIIFAHFINIGKYLRFLKKHPSLKLIYFHYDYLADPTFILACYLSKVKTVSNHERPMQSIWREPLIFDDYLIPGPKFKELYLKCDHVIENYHIIGLQRDSYIKDKKIGYQYKKYLKIKSSKTFIVCFDVNPISYFQQGLESETYSSRCIEEFYYLIISISKDFPNSYFSIKPKDEDIFRYEPFSDIKSAIDSINNIEIITDLKKYNPYKLASLADIIIGKHTSIMEEAFSAGKKIIFYDSEKYLYNSGYIFNDINLIERNYEGLKKRLYEIIEKDNYIPVKQWQTFKNNYFVSNDCNGDKLIREKVENIYFETI